MLLSEHRDAAHVGFEVGYESASQFSREYRRLFGAAPVQDTARVRRALTPRKGLSASVNKESRDQDACFRKGFWQPLEPVTPERRP